MMAVEVAPKLSRAFVWRRLHSLMGLWLVIFLIEHLLVNSQAALLLGENGRGFVEMVNSIHNLPYLPVIEIVLLGVPIFIHLVWGIQYLFTAKYNSTRTSGASPALPEYSRNHAYTWQRITSWILVFGLIGHIAKFRFIDYPDSLNRGTESVYFAPLTVDDGIYTVAERLKTVLYTQAMIEKEKEELAQRMDEQALLEARAALQKARENKFDPQKAMIFTAAQRFEEKIAWVKQLEKYHLSDNQLLAVTSNFGTMELLIVRDTFKSPLYVGLYTLFVLAACFHGFNGFWTFLITWGIVLRMSAQKGAVKLAVALMLLVAFLGLISIWGTYWLNLRT